MSQRYVVSTKCPTCDAPLDFSEGTNAIQCQYCRSNLLVTGRKQTLSYYISPKLNAHRAVAKAGLAHKQKRKAYKVVKPQLYFLPYYRLTGHDLRWEEKIQEKTQPALQDFSPSIMNRYEWENAFSSGTGFSVLDLAGNLLGKFFGSLSEEHTGEKTSTVSQHTAAQRKGDPTDNTPYIHHTRRHTSTAIGDSGIEAVFRDRYVGKNFIACNLQGYGMYSLGVRPGVLRLELFHAETVKAMGKIAGVGTTPDDAFSRGLKTAMPQKVLYRKVLGQVLSIIYFPFWLVEVDQNGTKVLTVIDAITEKIIRLDAPVGLYETLDRATVKGPQTIGFRPLVCPNCGWDLPVRPEDVIFFCSSCHRPWQIMGNMLYEVNYQVAGEPSSSKNGSAQYLPHWVLQSRVNGGSPTRLFLPAFRFLRLKALKNLARVLTNKQPDYKTLEGKTPDLHGCFYDQEDALKLAQMTYVGMAKDFNKAVQEMEDDRLSISDTTLTWLPFYVKGLSLIDPYTGFSLPRNLLR